MVQMLSIGSGALVLAAVVVLAVIAFRTTDMQRRASTRTLFLVYFVGIAPALAMSALWWKDALRVMIELHGIAFRSENGAVLRKDIRERSPGSSRLLIGDVATRDRRVPQTLLGTLVFRDGLSIELPPPERRAGVIATTAHGLLGAQEIENGDRICIGSECWTYNEDDDSFTLGKKKFAIPPRQTKVPGLDWAIPLPFAKPITAGLRTYSVDFLARQGDAARSQDSLRSFIAYSQPGPRLRVLVLDANVTLRKAGPASTRPTSFEVAEGSRIHLYTLPSAGESFEANGITERRSAIYRRGVRSFALDFDTPEIHSLTERELKALHLESQDKDKRVALAMGDAQMIDRSLYFTGASESVALQSSSLIELPLAFPSSATSDIRILSPRGPTDATLGGVSWIGTSDLAAVRMSVIRPPLLLLLAALVLQLLKVGCASASRFTLAQALLAGSLELLAGVRLMFGHRTWAMPPHRLEAAELGLLAWMMLPWIFIVASAPVLSLRSVRRDGFRAFPHAWLPALGGLLFSAIFCARLVEGPKKLVWLACHLLAIVVALLRSAEVREWFSQRWKKWSGSELTPYLVCGVAFLVVRVALLFFGFKESIMFPGGRVSLSAIHIPAAAILQGAFLWRVWQRTIRNGRLQRNDLLAALLLMTLVWILPAGLTSDVGLALLNVPVFLLLLLAIDRRNVIVRVLIVLTLLFVAGAPLARVFLPAVASEETLLSLASDSNYARFLHFAAPEQLQQMATKRGESLAITSAILQRYISTGFFGVGYGHTDVSPHLGDTALRDFAPAVFIAAEWGLVGTLAMMLLYALIGYIAWRVTPLGTTRTGMPTRSSPAAMVAAVAGVTIAVASVYMILANHELVLLTGKNAYLFGLDSAGDVLETLGLLLVIAYGAAVARDSADVVPGGLR
ncbi:MAG TPA: hypothetical protein VGQ76_06070 [Thermoanaerobaculia bacterium]|jgi:hypothetical protein|nr:hypothetical protein [Thermoanaerobaculia bacterium]